MNEKLIEKNLGLQVKKLGGLSVKFWPITFTGFPDRMVLMPGGRVWFVELKTTGKKPSPMQKVVITKLRALGFGVLVIDSKEVLSEFINYITP